MAMRTEADIVSTLRDMRTPLAVAAADLITKLRAEGDAAARHTAWAVTESGEIASLWMTEEAAVKIMAHHRLRSKGFWDVESVTLVRRAPAMFATHRSPTEAE